MIEIENNFQQKIMTQRFIAPTTLGSAAAVQAWRADWLKALTSWHSPYKAVIDVTHLTLAGGDDTKKALDVMFRFFKGFFLREVVAFGKRDGQGHDLLPFTVFDDAEAAYAEVGLRQPKTRDPADFRATIQLQNHFQTHVVELNFAAPVIISTPAQVATLKSKLMNNLMQWHSKWSLLVDCTNLEVTTDVHADFDTAFKALRGFFMKTVIGYAPKGSKETYPFPVYRARHKAAAALEGEGNFSGDKADCKSKTPAVK